MSERFEAIWNICAEVAGIDATTCERKILVQITECAGAICSEINRPYFRDPSKLEAEIDGIQRDIRKLVKRIEALDPRARMMARWRGDGLDAIMEVLGTASDPSAREDAHKKWDELAEKPMEDWIDFRTLRQLRALEDALVRPIESAINAAPPGAGRRPNRRAYEVALAAAQAYRKLTNADPTFWNGGETPFSRMVRNIYECGGIEADIRKPILAAMHKLKHES